MSQPEKHGEPLPKTSPYRKLREALSRHTKMQVNMASVSQAFGISKSELCGMELGREDPSTLHQLEIWRSLGATEEQLAWLARKIVAAMPAPARQLVEQDPNGEKAQAILMGLEQWVEFEDDFPPARITGCPESATCYLRWEESGAYVLGRSSASIRALGQAMIAVADQTERHRKSHG